ncbi:uncharacterized protein LOC131620159 [Vicia villosa]|uniref:uncharacterized protein LOC131620159 n=1 Tax=Vicia villosa TaxID=3911 RepID=UPI00273B49B8|nr:uncharacterized protein LOC131620159 [Vicia villosa]
MKQRRRINHLGPLNHVGVVVESVEEVREVVFNHFSNKFFEVESVRPTLDGIHFRSISGGEASEIEKPFLENEIKEAVWNCGGEKSPGPDGYSFLFLKKCWHITKVDFVNFFKSFFEGNFISKTVCSSFLTLIPKCKNPLSLDDYRPICLVGCMYKVVVKLLAGRLKGVLNSIISNSQSVFVPGRQLLDGVLVANEVVDFARKEGKIVFFSRLILRRLMISVDILQFVDDTLIVGEGNWKHVRALKVVLRAFEIVSGLGINFHKSKLIGINSNNHFLDAVSHFLSCKREESCFHFLGIPIGCNPRKESTWNPLVAKMKSILEGWTNRFLNLGGRITLLKSVLSSLAIFTMSFYKVPSRVVKKFTSIQNKFLWGGVEDKRKIHWVKWSDVNFPLEDGGLGVKNINLFNFALLCKWRWRILEGSNSLW